MLNKYKALQIASIPATFHVGLSVVLTNVDMTCEKILSKNYLFCVEPFVFLWHL